MRPRLFDAYDEELEAPDFDGRPFSTGDRPDDHMSRAAGWGLILALLFAVIAVSSLRAGLALTGLVMFGVAAGVFGLACISVRKTLREYMEYRHPRT